MNESTYAAMRAYIDVAVELRVDKVTQPLHEEIRSLRGQLETRSAPPLASTPGKDGSNGKDGKDGLDGKDGRDGVNGKDGAAGAPGRDGAPGARGEPGAKGDRGADGIATRAEIEEIVERKAADITVRTFADTYKGVFKPDERYTRGVLTTWGGSLWLSLVDTSRKPGDNNTDWRLVVKK